MTLPQLFLGSIYKSPLGYVYPSMPFGSTLDFNNATWFVVNVRGSDGLVQKNIWVPTTLLDEGKLFINWDSLNSEDQSLCYDTIVKYGASDIWSTVAEQVNTGGLGSVVLASAEHVTLATVAEVQQQHLAGVDVTEAVKNVTDSQSETSSDNYYWLLAALGLAAILL